MLPGKICNELDKINRNFLWGDTIERKKLHLIKWEIISRPKDEGGLGIKNSKCRNKALLAKRAWDFILGSKETWANILWHKYTPIRLSSGHPSSIWKCLRHTKDICEKGKGWLIRNGKIINFWHDNWLESGPLRALIHYG